MHAIIVVVASMFKVNILGIFFFDKRDDLSKNVVEANSAMLSCIVLYFFFRILFHCGPLSWSQWPPVIEVNHYYDVLVGRGIPKPSFLAKGDDVMMIRVGNFNARKATYWRQFIGTFWFEILIQSY